MALAPARSRRDHGLTPAKRDFEERTADIRSRMRVVLVNGFSQKSRTILFRWLPWSGVSAGINLRDRSPKCPAGTAPKRSIVEVTNDARNVHETAWKVVS